MKYTYEQVLNTKEQTHTWTYVLLLKHIVVSLTWFFANFTNLTPNMISLLGIIPYSISAYFFFNTNFLLGAIFSLVGLILDMVDGRLARVKGMGSNYGAFFDNYIGMIGWIVMHIAFFIGLSKIIDSTLSFVLGSLVFFFLYLRSTSSLQVRSLSKVEPKKNKHTPSIVSFLSKKGLMEPLSLPELLMVIYIYGPLFTYFFFSPSFLVWIIIFCLVLMTVKEFMFFSYYKKILTGE